ncbi:MAG TPA: carbohydrate ABC transporter permease [Ktedonobacterales bacterium]|nr:carbohydrate ABC transporter permease [Ktedonobacterales bacterium]
MARSMSSTVAWSSWFTRWRRTGTPLNQGTIGPVGTLIRLVVLLLFGIFFGLPLVWLILATTKTDTQLSQDFPLSIGSLSKIGTDWQHLLIFDDGVITQWYLNSVLYALATLVLALAISLPAGYALATAKPKARSLLLWLTLVAMLLPISALVLPLFLEMNVVHLVDTPWAVILPTAFFPFGVYLAFVYFAVSLPKDLLAAARIDGASEWQLFWHIGIPLARPLLGLLVFLNFTATWNNYFLPFVMLQDTNVYNLPVGLQALISCTPALTPACAGADLPIYKAELSLAGVIIVLPVAIIFMFSQRFVTSGVLTGSIKD